MLTTTAVISDEPNWLASQLTYTHKFSEHFWFFKDLFLICMYVYVLCAFLMPAEARKGC